MVLNRRSRYLSKSWSRSMQIDPHLPTSSYRFSASKMSQWRMTSLTRSNLILQLMLTSNNIYRLSSASEQTISTMSLNLIYKISADCKYKNTKKRKKNLNNKDRQLWRSKILVKMILSTGNWSKQMTRGLMGYPHLRKSSRLSITTSKTGLVV